MLFELAVLVLSAILKRSMPTLLASTMLIVSQYLLKYQIDRMHFEHEFAFVMSVLHEFDRYSHCIWTECVQNRLVNKCIVCRTNR